MVANFSGDPRTLWVTQGDVEDRKMTLLDDFWYDDPQGRRWLAPKGAAIDGATIPRALWALVGSPYTGDYRRASIVHDVACVEAGDDIPARRAADRMFFHGCRTGGCSPQDATVLYVGVRIGAFMRSVPAWQPEMSLSLEPRTSRPAAAKRIEADFQFAADQVLAQGPVDDIGQIERRTDLALSQAAGFSLLAL